MISTFLSRTSVIVGPASFTGAEDLIRTRHADAGTELEPLLADTGAHVTGSVPAAARLH